MPTPGIALLGRTVALAGLLSFATVALAQFAAKSCRSFPPWILLVGVATILPIGYVLHTLCVAVIRRRQAARMGARLAPSLKGKWFGNFDVMTKLIEQFKNGYPGDGFVEMLAELGSCFNMRFMYEDMIFTTEPSHIKAILATDFANYVKGDRFKQAMLSVLGAGVFNSDGQMWKFHRSMTRPFFSRDRISHFDIFDRHAEDVITQMKSRFHAGYAVDFQDAMSRFTLDSATEFLFGNCVHSLSAGFPYPYNVIPSEICSDKAKISEDFSVAFAEAQSVIAERPRKRYLWPLFEMFKDNTAEPMRIINSFIDPILKDSIAKKKFNEASGEKNVARDSTLLDHLVQMTTDPVILKDEILNVLIAGRDTTAATLTITIYLLSMYPHVMTRLREEIITKVGQTNRPTYDDIREMKYLRAVINESMRLFCPVPFNVRESVNASTLPGASPLDQPIYVPPKTHVTFSIFLMHRRKDLWGPDADEFDPDRFLDERLEKYLTPNPFIFLPFNTGPRICLGQQFAYNEMSFMLIRLLQTFSSVTLATEAQRPDTLPPVEWAMASGRKQREKFWPKSHLTLYAHGGLWIHMNEAENS